jgi:group I intron endonuclease
MSCGIYKLSFQNTNKVYIGQSVNIEYRFKQHLNSFKNLTAPIKLQEAFTLYGTPSLEILSECNREELSTQEEEAIEIFDSLANGFNSCSSTIGNIGTSGTLNGNSKYSEEQVVYVLDLLIENTMGYRDISSITEVSVETVGQIAGMFTHTWLKNKYPDKYAILESLVNTRKSDRSSAKSRGILYPLIKNVHNNVFVVENIAAFAREHNLNKDILGRVLRKQAASHKGWKLV